MRSEREWRRSRRVKTDWREKMCGLETLVLEVREERIRRTMGDADVGVEVSSCIVKRAQRVGEKSVSNAEVCR